MYAFMYIYMYACMYIYMYACMYIYIMCVNIDIFITSHCIILPSDPIGVGLCEA